MLDLKQAEKLVEQLRTAEDRKRQGIDPSLPLDLALARQQAQRPFEGFRNDDLWFEVSSAVAPDLVTAGLSLVARWLSGK
jgi:hypothetical protein